MRHRRHHRDVRPRPERQVVRRLDVRRAHHVDPPRVDDDELRPLAQPLLQPAGEDRMPVGRVGADDDHDVGMLDAVEVLRPGRGAVGLPEPVAGRRMADPRAGVGVVVAEDRPRQLLHQVGFLVGAAARGDDPDRLAPMLLLDAPQPRRGEAERLLPAHLAPRLVDRVADHRVQDPVPVRGVAVGEAPLDAGMPAVRLAVLVGHHPHQRVAVQLRLERRSRPRNRRRW